MTSPLSNRRGSKTPPPGDTGQEALYLRSLSDRQVPVAIKLRDGETVRGWIEYFDDAMLRLTRRIADYYLCPWGQVLETVLPAGVRSFAKFLPLTPVVNLLRGLWNGDGWAGHGGDVLFLAGITLVFTLIAVRTFRWE